MPLFYTATVTANTSTASTATPWLPLNLYPDDFDVGVGIAVSGQATVRIEGTFESPASGRDASVEVFTMIHASQATAGSNTGAALPYPVAAIRLVAAEVSAPPAEATVFVRQTGH